MVIVDVCINRFFFLAWVRQAFALGTGSERVAVKTPESPARRKNVRVVRHKNITDRGYGRPATL